MENDLFYFSLFEEGDEGTYLANRSPTGSFSEGRETPISCPPQGKEEKWISVFPSLMGEMDREPSSPRY
jgi:hypothetical protein